MKALYWLSLLAAVMVVSASAPVVAADAAGDHATDAKHEETNTNPLEIDPDLSLVTLIIFVGLLAVLGKFAWGPIMAGLAKREQSVADEITAAEAANAEAKRLLAEYESKLISAGTQVDEMLAGAKSEAESMKQTILDEAKAAAEAERERATREIGAAKNAALRDITEQGVQVAFNLATKTLRREIKPDEHQDLVQQTLAQMPSEN